MVHFTCKRISFLLLQDCTILRHSHQTCKQMQIVRNRPFQVKAKPIKLIAKCLCFVRFPISIFANASNQFQTTERLGIKHKRTKNRVSSYLFAYMMPTHSATRRFLNPRTFIRKIRWYATLVSVFENFQTTKVQTVCKSLKKGKMKFERHILELSLFGLWLEGSFFLKFQYITDDVMRQKRSTMQQWFRIRNKNSSTEFTANYCFCNWCTGYESWFMSDISFVCIELYCFLFISATHAKGS